MWWPLAIAVTLIGSGTVLLVAARAAGRKAPEDTEMVPMPLPSSTALMTPSRLAVADSEPEPEAVEPARSPADRVPEEPKLSAKQRERLERLMAAVKSEFQSLLDEEKRKSQV